MIPVTHFLRLVRGAMLKGQNLGDQWRELFALVAFVSIVTALAMVRYRRTLD
jgi:ABC-2 type transport system permease protein